MENFTVKGKTYTRPVACCGFCGAPVFVLHDRAGPYELINESILKSKGIPPQPDPYPEQVPWCATCGRVWTYWNFEIKEGAL